MEVQALIEIVTTAGSGGVLLLAGWVIAKVGPLVKEGTELLNTQRQLAEAQLKVLGEEPHTIPVRAKQAVEDIEIIRKHVEAHA